MGKYSYGDFMQRQFIGEPAKDFGGEVIGSCFQQNAPNTKVFPADTRATFVRCNLNNCEIPPGCTVGEGCVNHQHAEQNDREQWVLDAAGKPVKPLHEKEFDRLGVSKDPATIPVALVAKSPVRIADEKASAVKEIAVKEAEIAKLKADYGIASTPVEVTR